MELLHYYKVAESNGEPKIASDENTQIASRKTLVINIGLIVTRGNRITAGTNCHGCADSRSVRVGERRAHGGFRRGRKSPRVSTTPRKRCAALRIMLSCHRHVRFHGIARDSESEESPVATARSGSPTIKIARGDESASPGH